MSGIQIGAAAPVPYRETFNERGVGLTTLERTDSINLGNPTSNQELRLAYFTARRNETVAQARFFSGTTAAGATPTLVRIGLYSIASNGDGTLVAATANDTTLFAAAATTYTRNLIASFAMIAGQRYAGAVLVVTGATAPTITGGTVADSAEMLVAPAIAARIPGQSDLPASFLGSAPIASGSRPYIVFMP